MLLRGLLICAPPLVLLVAAVVFGGASRLNPIGLMIVEGLGILTLVPALLRSPDFAYSRLTIAAIGLLGLAGALVLLQLTPLPPDLLKALPGRGPLASAVALANLPNHWRPMSLAPDETQGAALFLIAPAGMFLASLQCDARERLWLVLAALCVALLSLALGAIQLLDGSGAHFQIYAAAAASAPNGFFANRNHQAALMIGAICLSATLVGRLDLPFGLGRRPLAALALMFAFALAVAATQSRNGLLLLGPILVLALLIGQSGAAGVMPGRRLAMVVAVAVGVSAGAFVLMGGGVTDRLPNHDVQSTVVAAGQALQPVGGGLGAFDTVYRAVEPLDRITPEYLNHVHDDYIELWLEGGWPAIALIAAAIVWWSFGAYAAWFGPLREDAALARSGSLIALTLLLLSALDYPLRTPALAVVFAFACALMLPTPRLKQSD